MDSLLTTFLLFLAAITAILSYLVLPRLSAATLVTVAALGLAAGVWWHWTQFGVEYRMSTWQEQLRHYASYTLLFVVILLSYAFYAFAWSGSTAQQYTEKVFSPIRNRNVRSSPVSASEGEEEEEEIPWSPNLNLFSSAAPASASASPATEAPASMGLFE